VTVPTTDWRACGDLEALLSAEMAADLARESGLTVTGLTPRYLRLKVGESALVGFDAAVDGQPGDVPVHVRTFADQSRAEVLHDKWMDKRRTDSLMSPPIARSPRGSSVFFAFPNDNELDGLRDVITPRGWRHIVPTLQRVASRTISKSRSSIVPVRYKPGRRLVGRVTLVGDDGERFVDGFFRWFGDDRGAAIGRLTETAHRGGLPVPQLIDTSTDGRLVIEETLDGIDGVVAVANGELDVDRFVSSLRDLHRVQIERPPMAPRQVLAEALMALDQLALVEPTLAAAAMQLALHLRSVDEPGGPTVLVHGDLHLGQLVVHRGTARMVDLERAHHGHPHTDLASLAAHLVEVQIDSPHGRGAAVLDEVRTAWQQVGGDGDDLIGVPLACALVQRALLSFRTFDPRWPMLGAALLERAIDAAGATRWHVVHARPSGHWTASTGGGHPRVAIGEDDRWTDVDPQSDPRLPGLPDALRRGRLVAHRPGRRAVVHSGTSYLKVLPPKRVDAFVDRLTTVGPLLPPPILAPRVLGVERSLGIVEIESMPGTPFHDLLIGADRAARDAAIEFAARLVHALADVDVSTIDLPGAAAGGEPRAWTTAVSRLHPSLAIVNGPVVERLEALLERHQVTAVVALVHGDLHDRNLLLHGEEGVLIDLDSVGIGDPAIDVGNLAAHLVLRALQRGDSRRIGDTDADRLLDTAGATDRHRVHVARTLHRLSCVYRLRARWSYLSDDLLAASAEWADSVG
jgi:aminoglycoside phosphotransferase (APT) family kinase protein